MCRRLIDANCIDPRGWAVSLIGRSVNTIEQLLAAHHLICGPANSFEQRNKTSSYTWIIISLSSKNLDSENLDGVQKYQHACRRQRAPQYAPSIDGYHQNGV
jgi:hypothetical protein